MPENLNPAVDRADAIRTLVPESITMPEMALRFILSNRDVSTIIPGKLHHVEANIACSDAGLLPDKLHKRLQPHRWDRQPTDWSQ